jgi:predicted TIM-barrel fold metal-dependent hydrolase
MDKPFAQMPPASQAPLDLPPTNACDAHVHLVAGPEYPLWDGRVENPAQGQDFDGWLDLYRTHLKTLGFSRGVIVHSILYGTDNSVTIETVKRLGDGFKGVGLLGDAATDTELDQFATDGLMALRLNYVHGGVLTWDGAKALAPRLADRGLHLQMLLHADQHIDDLADDIRALPVPLCIDHIGWPTAGLSPDGKGIDTLCALLAEGHIWVKLSAIYRLCNAPYSDGDDLIAKLVAANPDQCLWGSDWPHLMLNGAEMPQANQLLDSFHSVVTDRETRTKILTDNPAQLFQF